MKLNHQSAEKWVDEVGVGVPEGYKIETKIVGGKRVGPHRVIGPSVIVGTFSRLDEALAEANRHSRSKRDDDPDADEANVDNPKC